MGIRNSSRSSFSRRHFLATTAAAGAGLLTTPAFAARAPLKKALPKPNKSGIEHIIIVMMENRSFDHFLGWVPGAEGPSAGITYPDEFGVRHAPMPLAPEYQGCTHPDPDHSYAGGRVEYNNGACDGWLLAGNNDEYAIGFYTRQDLPFYSAAT